MKKRKSNFKPLLITIFICLIWILFNESGLIKWMQLRYEENILTQELYNIQLEKENLLEHIDILENDIKSDFLFAEPLPINLLVLPS